MPVIQTATQTSPPKKRQYYNQKYLGDGWECYIAKGVSIHFDGGRAWLFEMMYYDMRWGVDIYFPHMHPVGLLTDQQFYALADEHLPWAIEQRNTQFGYNPEAPAGIVVQTADGQQLAAEVSWDRALAASFNTASTNADPITVNAADTGLVVGDTVTWAESNMPTAGRTVGLTSSMLSIEMQRHMARMHQYIEQSIQSPTHRVEMQNFPGTAPTWESIEHTIHHPDTMAGRALQRAAVETTRRGVTGRVIRRTPTSLTIAPLVPTGTYYVSVDGSDFTLNTVPHLFLPEPSMEQMIRAVCNTGMGEDPIQKMKAIVAAKLKFAKQKGAALCKKALHGARKNSFYLIMGLIYICFWLSMFSMLT